MGIFSKERLTNLYWLGRYVERTQATIKLFLDSFDRMIDGDENDYREFCKSVGIPDVYGSKDAFVRGYPFDAGNPFSIASNFSRAFDNAVVMRDSLGSDVLAYLQIVQYDIASAGQNEERAIFLMQNAIDHIFAFWGCLDDLVDDEATRCIVKLGKDVERLDLHFRLKGTQAVLKKDFMRLQNHLARSGMKYDKAVLDTLRPMILGDQTDHENALRLIHKLVKN